VLLSAGDAQAGALHACLHAGSLSRAGASEPDNCGRGTPVTFMGGDDLEGCLYAGALSRLSFSTPSSCVRGVQIGFAAVWK